MKAQEGIIEYLNHLLTGELTGINEYFIHSEMCKHWGYERLYEAVRAESIEEMRHAEELIRRILFLEGVPNMQRLGAVRVGETVPEQMELDRDLEQEAVKLFSEAIAHCTSVGDQGTRQMLAEMLESEEAHLSWLETQIETISQIGVQNYLSQQVRG